MDFTAFFRKSVDTYQVKKSNKNQLLIDPYFRRYYSIKYAVQSIQVGFGLWVGKLIVENIRAIKFHGLSPWFEGCIATFYFSTLIYTNFDIFHQERNSNEDMKMKFHSKHFFNSQYWH